MKKIPLLIIPEQTAPPIPEQIISFINDYICFCNQLIIPMQTDHPIPMQCDHPIPMQTDHPIPMQCDHPIPV